ncbi:hypothetical protein [Bradyrhizobium sp. 153]|uniref:hypothetical protein n=1 Tax=Bradyrhizobium sp. 153 TaxID=2782627 RepID=UPI00201C093B|nr:hypothetical protein [Bradyrhizobium sp. 153]
MSGAGSLPILAVLTTIVLATEATRDARAQPLKATIVGLGAATCQQFNHDVTSNPLIRKDYMAWAQGFMSGILSSRPPGVDEGLDLAPPTFPLMRQLDFLGDYCARNASLDFSDGVAALYKRLRQEGKT